MAKNFTLKVKIPVSCKAALNDLRDYINKRNSEKRVAIEDVAGSLILARLYEMGAFKWIGESDEPLIEVPDQAAIDEVLEDTKNYKEANNVS